jgi:hypothetical protein
MLQVVQQSTHVSTRQISAHFYIPQTILWKMMHNECLYPYHIKAISHLELASYVWWLNFCCLLHAQAQLCNYILLKQPLFVMERIILRIPIYGLLKILTQKLRATFNTGS